VSRAGNRAAQATVSSIVNRSLVAIGLVVSSVPSLPTRAESAKSSRGVVDRVVAVVNDAVILDSELSTRMRVLVDDAQAITDPNERSRRIAKLHGQLLDQMIADELVVQAAKAAHVTVDDSEVKVAMDYIKEQNHLTQEQLEQAMAAQGVTRDSYRLDLIRQRAINMIVGAKIKITDEDLRGRYRELEQRANRVSKVLLAHILVAIPEHATEQQRDAATTKANAALARIRAGESFAEVAKGVSDDATTKNTGGDLGWVASGTIPAQWENVVFAMAKGDVRGPVLGAAGLELFYAGDVQREALPPFESMKKQLSEELENQQLAKLRTAWIDGLRKAAYIDIKGP